jgi:hypothetical protein
MCALCFGAGIEGRCATTITTETIIDDGHGLLVVAQGRIVLLLRTWEPRLRAVLDDTTPGDTLIGDRLGNENAANYVSHHIALDEAGTAQVGPCA